MYIGEDPESIFFLQPLRREFGSASVTLPERLRSRTLEVMAGCFRREVIKTSYEADRQEDGTYSLARCVDSGKPYHSNGLLESPTILDHLSRFTGIKDKSRSYETGVHGLTAPEALQALHDFEAYWMGPKAASDRGIRFRSVSETDIRPTVVSLIKPAELYTSYLARIDMALPDVALSTVKARGSHLKLVK
jgi:hypothetical protein